MSDPGCPRCDRPLDITLAPGRVMARACPEGHGVFVTLAELSHALPFAASARLEEARERATPGEAPCPACRTPMRLARLEPDGEHLELDACPACGGHWFDASELERLRQPRPKKGGSPRAPAGSKGLHLASAPDAANAGLVVAFEGLLGLLGGW